MTTLKDVQMSILKDRIQMLEAKEKKLITIKRLVESWKKHESYKAYVLLTDIRYVLEGE